MVQIDVRIVLGQKTARNDIFNESGKMIFSRLQLSLEKPNSCYEYSGVPDS